MPKSKTQKHYTQRDVVRIGKYLNEIITIKDPQGNLVHKITKPLMTEFYARDVIQAIVGATLLAVPVTFTEETWRLGAQLPLKNIALIGMISISFIGIFVYYNFYRHRFKDNIHHFIKRVFFIYLIAILVVGLILTLIEQAPLQGDWSTTFKRIVIAAFPASMSAAVTDMIK